MTGHDGDPEFPLSSATSVRSEASPLRVSSCSAVKFSMFEPDGSVLQRLQKCDPKCVCMCCKVFDVRASSRSIFERTSLCTGTNTIWKPAADVALTHYSGTTKCRHGSCADGTAQPAQWPCCRCTLCQAKESYACRH